MKENNSQSLRQSRELEALLSKLNGGSSDAAPAIQPPPTPRISDELLYDESCTSLPQMDDEDDPAADEIDMDTSYDDSQSLNESFFIGDVQETPSAVVPVGSGSFARVPSGGFHLVLASIKSACQGMMSRVKSIGHKNDTSRQADENGYAEDAADRRKRNILKGMIAAAILIGLIGVIVSATTDDEETAATEIAAQAPVAGNEEYAILALDDPDENIPELRFDDDDFSIPALEGGEEGDEGLVIVGDSNDTPKAEDKPAAVAAAEPGRLKEARLYNSSDNVMATVSAGQTMKVKKSCIMREGPASKFGLVKQIQPGSTIQILGTTEEDWVVQSGSVWTKAGQTPRLGPGTQFAVATKGMKIPQPKSRVISSNNWRYVQFGKVYGYVGPACFK